MTTFQLMVATDQNRGIGKDGSIPWREPNDQKWFANVTKGAVLVMGHTTWKSLPTFMKTTRRNGRDYIVLSTTMDDIPGAAVVDSFDALLELRKSTYLDRTWIVIGGVSLYNYFLARPELLSDVFWTSIHATHDCDASIDVDIADQLGNNKGWTQTRMDIELTNGASYWFKRQS
jgi:dihydrofolate reductase